MPHRWSDWLKSLGQADIWVASAALVLMMVIPIIEIGMRPVLGQGVENASVLVQHLGLVLAMLGALAGERNGHLTTLGGGSMATNSDPTLVPTLWQRSVPSFANLSAALVCGLLTWASWRFVASEIEAAHGLAYGIPVWWVQFSMPLGFALLGAKLAARCSPVGWGKLGMGLLTPTAGFWLASAYDGTAVVLWPCVLLLVAALLAGAPVFAVLGGLALALFWQDGLPLAAIALSHYQITVNPSLPALPLFTLAGLVFARTGAAQAWLEWTWVELSRRVLVQQNPLQVDGNLCFVDAAGRPLGGAQAAAARASLVFLLPWQQAVLRTSRRDGG